MKGREGDPALQGAGLPEGSFPLEYFRKALLRGRLSHAYLFIGPAGSSRRRFALEIAKALFCERGSPCGSCGSCRSAEHGNHPGVHAVRPAEGKTAIEIEHAREIAGKIHLRRTGFLVVILEEADRMTLPAANALLKTLEEPTGDSLLLLIAQSTGGLLPTIVSRCHRIPFPEPVGAALASAPAGGPEGLEIPFQEGFFGARDVREWLETQFPGTGSTRDAVRAYLNFLIASERARWSPGSQEERADVGISDRLESILELRSDLDRNVNPDLILEGAFRLARMFQ